MFIELPKKAHDLTGRRFGRLVVLGPIDIRRYTGVTHVIWLCRCDCGAEKRVAAGHLRTGNTTSCGCHRRQLLNSGMRRKHGASKKLEEYRIWCHMISRCQNPNDRRYHDYGGRGITVCEEWRDDFMRFFSDMGLRPSPDHQLDRIDNNGNYEPGNCRWATRIEQANNKRNNTWLEAFGRRQTIPQWAREIGVKPQIIRDRVYRYGWPPERALSDLRARKDG